MIDRKNRVLRKYYWFAIPPLLVLAYLYWPLHRYEEVEEILQLHPRPAGVVFEVASMEGEALEWVLPQIQAYVKQLRKHNPDIRFAVVTHGMEQFSLTRHFSDVHTDVHQGVQSLQADNIPVHVCGNFARGQGYAASDFADYVDVAPTASGALRRYQRQGYVLFRIRKRL